MCRLVFGERGIGKTILLQTLCVVAKVAFGEPVLVLSHDFSRNDSGDRRYSIGYLLIRAI